MSNWYKRNWNFWMQSNRWSRTHSCRKSQEADTRSPHSSHSGMTSNPTIKSMEWIHSNHVHTYIDRLSEIDVHKIKYSNITKSAPEQRFNQRHVSMKPAIYRPNLPVKKKNLPNDPYIQAIKEKIIKESNQFNQLVSLPYSASFTHLPKANDIKAEDVCNYIGNQNQPASLTKYHCTIKQPQIRKVLKAKSDWVPK